MKLSYNVLKRKNLNHRLFQLFYTQKHSYNPVINESNLREVVKKKPILWFIIPNITYVRIPYMWVPLKACIMVKSILPTRRMLSMTMGYS